MRFFKISSVQMCTTSGVRAACQWAWLWSPHPSVSDDHFKSSQSSGTSSRNTPSTQGFSDPPLGGLILLQKLPSHVTVLTNGGEVGCESVDVFP